MTRINIILLGGNVTHLRYMPSGAAVLQFGLTVTPRRRSVVGELQEGDLLRRGRRLANRLRRWPPTSPGAALPM